MNYIWNLNIDQYIEVYELAKANGKKPGDSMEDEFLIVMNKHNLKPIAETNYDKDLLLGNLREEGLKIATLDDLNKQNKDLS